MINWWFGAGWFGYVGFPLKKGIVTDADVAANGGGEAEASSLAHSWDGAASRGVERRDSRDAHLLMTTDNAPRYQWQIGRNQVRFSDGSQVTHSEECTYLGGILTRNVNIAAEICQQNSFRYGNLEESWHVLERKHAVRYETNLWFITQSSGQNYSMV